MTTTTTPAIDRATIDAEIRARLHARRPEEERCLADEFSDRIGEAIHLVLEPTRYRPPNLDLVDAVEDPDQLWIDLRPSAQLRLAALRASVYDVTDEVLELLTKRVVDVAATFAAEYPDGVRWPAPVAIRGLQSEAG